MKILKKITPMLITLLFILVIISVFSCLLKDHPQLLGADYALRALGYSMFPAVRTNDLLFIKKGEKIEIDDIICFRRRSETEDYLVGHRVIEIQIYPSLAFKTKGDANKCSDGWVLEEDIVGRQILDIPFGFFLAKNCILLLAGMIVILIILVIKK